jgi:hypothetical protein
MTIADEDIVDAIADYMRECRAAAVGGAWRIIVARLRDHYGTKLVDRAVDRYMRALRQETRMLRRQVRQARADWMKRQ